MPGNNINSQNNPNINNAVETLKDAYSYLHPDYRNRRLAQLIFVVSMMFIIYGLIYGFILMDITGMNDVTMPWILKFIDMIFMYD